MQTDQLDQVMQAVAEPPKPRDWRDDEIDTLREENERLRAAIRKLDAAYSKIIKPLFA